MTTLKGLAKKYVLCLFFSFALFIVVWLSEMLRLTIMDIVPNPYSLANILYFFFMVFGVVPSILFVLWLINPLVVSTILKTFDLTEKSLEKKKPKKWQKSTELSENETEDEILELVRLVDRNFEVYWFDVWFRGGMGFPSAMLLVFLFVIYGFMFTAPTYERVVVGLSYTAVVFGYFSLMTPFLEDSVVNINFKRGSRCVEGDEKPLLRALIKMKARHQETDLEQIYTMNKDMFTREKLLEKLYE